MYNPSTVHAMGPVAGMRLVEEVDDPNRTSPTTVAADICNYVVADGKKGLMSNCIVAEDDGTVIANFQMMHRHLEAGDVEARDDENAKEPMETLSLWIQWI